VNINLSPWHRSQHFLKRNHCYMVPSGSISAGGGMGGRWGEKVSRGGGGEVQYGGVVCGDLCTHIYTLKQCQDEIHKMYLKPRMQTETCTQIQTPPHNHTPRTPPHTTHTPCTYTITHRLTYLPPHLKYLRVFACKYSTLHVRG
jgi:hypothetical protein